MLRVGAADYAVQGGDVALVGGAAGQGEAEPDPLAGVAHGAALFDVAGGTGGFTGPFGMDLKPRAGRPDRYGTGGRRTGGQLPSRRSGEAPGL